MPTFFTSKTPQIQDFLSFFSQTYYAFLHFHAFVHNAFLKYFACKLNYFKKKQYNYFVSITHFREFGHYLYQVFL